MAGIMATRPVDAIYNLERTLVDHVHTRALGAMMQHGLVELDSAIQLDSMGMKEQRQFFLDSLAGKTEADITPALQTISENTASQLELWAPPVMALHAKLGRTIRIFSALVPHPFAQAHTEGLRRILPDGSKLSAHGKPLITKDGVFTGEAGNMQKAETVSQLKMLGHRIAFAAESFTSGGKILKRAENPLLVNFSHRADIYREDSIIWHDNTPYRVKAQAGRQREKIVFDLSLEDHQTGLLNWIIRNDPEAREAQSDSSAIL